MKRIHTKATQGGDVRPKKALGQHFLTDESIASRIADTLAPYKGLPVMEVGPGMGVLTKYLIAGGHDVKVAEIDGESIDYPALQLSRACRTHTRRRFPASRLGADLP